MNKLQKKYGYFKCMKCKAKLPVWEMGSCIDYRLWCDKCETNAYSRFVQMK